MKAKNNTEEQLKRIDRRVTVTYGVVVLYILLASIVASAADIWIRIILGVGAAMLLLRAVLLDSNARNEVDSIVEQQKSTTHTESQP